MIKILCKNKNRIILNMENNTILERTKENKLSNNNNNNNEILIQKYYDSLTEIDKLAFKIAQEQLESSFDVEKTIGFIKWNSEHH